MWREARCHYPRCSSEHGRRLEQELLFDLRIGPLVAAFLLLAALDHALVVLPPCRARYEQGLAAGVNPFRWLEHSLSASLTVVLSVVAKSLLAWQVFANALVL